jgi:hypothetical protein
MNSLRIPRSLQAKVTALFVLLAAVGLSLTLQDARPAAEIEVPGVSGAALERAGIRLLSPESAPAITADHAQTVAYAQAPTLGLPITQPVLVRLVDVNNVPQLDRLVWVNIIDLTEQSDSAVAPAQFPSGGNYYDWGAEPIRVERTYHLIFIDATTGEYIYAISG